MRRLLLVVVELCAAVGVFASGGTESVCPDAVPKVIQFWCTYGQPDRVAAIQRTISAFEVKNPGITVKPTLVPWSTLHQRWIAGRMAKCLPDLTTGTDSELIAMWYGGVLAPMNDVVETMGGPAAFIPAALTGLNIDGEQIAIPHYTFSWKLLVRKDWLEENGLSAPRSWDDLKRVAVALSSPPDHYGFDLPLSIQSRNAKEWLDYFMRTNGARFFSQEGNPAFDTPQTIEAVKFLVDLYRKAGDPASINLSGEDINSKFISGKVAFTMASGSIIDQARKDDSGILGSAEIIPTPYQTQPGTAGSGLVGLGIFKDSSCRAEADKFTEFLLRNDQYLEFLPSVAGQIPITTAMAASTSAFWKLPLISSNSDLMQQWVSAAVDGRRTGMFFGPTPVASAGLPDSEIENMFQSIIVDNEPVEQAVKHVQEQMTANLKAAGF